MLKSATPRASPRIHSQFVPETDPVSEPAQQKAERIVARYGTKGCAAFTWGPNWSDTKPMDPPTGFTFRVPYDAPLIMDPFSHEKLFSGTTVCSLNDAVFSATRTKVTEEDLLRDYQRTLQRMNAALDGEVESFAGIYSSLERDSRGQFWSKRYHLVVQSGNAETSRDIYRRMEEITDSLERSTNSKSSALVATRPDQTWKSFFKDSRLNSDILQANSTRRRALLYKLGTALGLEASSWDTRNGLLPTPTAETTTHKTVDNKNDRYLVYHSATVDPEVRSGATGIVITETPYMGLTILHGPSSDTDKFDYGTPWKGSNGDDTPFPVCTGRSLTRHDVMASTKNRKGPWIVAQDSIHFTNDSSWKLAPTCFRPRDIPFKNAERLLGYDPCLGSTSLKPILVFNSQQRK